MCGLCGIFGESADWSQGATPTGQSADPVARRQARARRIALLNDFLRPLHLRVSDWQGSQYQIASATGKTLLADNLSQIWAAVEKISGGAFDPLATQAGFSPLT